MVQIIYWGRIIGLVLRKGAEIFKAVQIELKELTHAVPPDTCLQWSLDNHRGLITVEGDECVGVFCIRMMRGLRSWCPLHQDDEGVEDMVSLHQNDEGVEDMVSPVSEWWGSWRHGVPASEWCGSWRHGVPCMRMRELKARCSYIREVFLTVDWSWSTGFLWSLLYL